MGILGFFFILILVLFLFGATLLHGIIRWFFTLLFKILGIQNPQDRATHASGNKTSSRRHDHSRRSQKQHGESPSAPTRKKIFDNDEGEYVDFEEMKD